MIYFEKPTFDLLIDDYADETYIRYLYESNGISKLLLNVLNHIYNLIKPYIEEQKILTIYTGYNWDFTEDDLILVNNENIQYPLYIQLYIPEKESILGETYRDLNAEKLGNTKIEIRLSINCEDLLGTIIHELQHIREMYAKINKNILANNPKNIYGNPNLDKDIKLLYKTILSCMSDAELHAHIQSVYHYVLTHPEIKTISYKSKELDEISRLAEFYDVWQAFYNNKQFAKYVYYILEMSTKLGLILKKNFNFKNHKLTKQYLIGLQNETVEFDITIYNSIAKFIQDNLFNYQRKIARTIYFAIDDRDHTITNNTYDKINTNFKNKFIK